MIKRPFLIAVAGLLVVVGALLLLFLSDEEVPENNSDASTTVNSNVNQNPLKKTANKNENKTDRFALEENIDSIILSIDTKSRTLNLSIKELEIRDEKEALSKYGSSASGACLGDILGSVLKK